jgi:hypothetical protein
MWAALFLGSLLITTPGGAQTGPARTGDDWWPLGGAGSDSSACSSLARELTTRDGRIRPRVEKDAYQELSAATTDGCRDAVEQNKAPEIIGPLERALLDSQTQTRPDATSLTAQTALGVLHPRASWATSWMIRFATQRTAPVCLAALADSDQPTAKKFVDGELGQLFHKTGNYVSGSYVEVDSFVLDAAELSPRLRARLGALLPHAYRLRPVNYGSLWAVVCSNTDPPVLDKATCTRLVSAEDRWQLEPDRPAALMRTGLILTAAGIAVAGGVSERNNNGGLAIATTAAALGAGLALGTFTDWLAQRNGGGGGTEHAGGALAGRFYGTIIGVVFGTAGGLIAYEALKGAPDGRAATTIAGVAMAALCSIRLVWK